MRFVENSGWYSDSAVFVSGSENPHYAEYRIFNVASAKLVQVYAGYGFATCASKGEVAYVADPDESNPKTLHVEVNGKDLIEVSADSDPSYFLWSADCDRLAYIEGGDAAKPGDSEEERCGGARSGWGWFRRRIDCSRQSGVSAEGGWADQVLRHS